MPFVNSSGNVAHGKGGVGAFYNNVQFDQGGSACWLNKGINDKIVYQRAASPNWYVALYDVSTKEITRAITNSANQFYGVGGNILFADGSVWASWLNEPGVGLFASTGLHLPSAGLLGVGPEGEIGYRPEYQSNGPARVREVNGNDFLLSNDVVTELQLLGQGRALWTIGPSIVVVRNIPQPLILNGGCWFPRVSFIQNQWWILYYNSVKGVVLHPFNSFFGYVITPPTQNAWPDAAVISNIVIRVVWSVTEGESAGDIRIKDINIATESRVNLETTNPEPPIPPEPPIMPGPQPPNYQVALQSVKDRLLAAGQNLSGQAGGKIVEQFAYEHRAERFGLLSKPDGNNWKGRSVDYLCYGPFDNYTASDVVGDCGGLNTIQWPDRFEQGTGDRFVPILTDPGYLTTGPIPPIPPIPPNPPDTELEERVAVLEQQVKDLTTQVNNSLKSGDKVALKCNDDAHYLRAHDQGGLTREQKPLGTDSTGVGPDEFFKLEKH